jgi:drug/metabolite transporter (DMT)-like permease
VPAPGHARGVAFAAASATGFGLMAIFATRAYDAGLDVPSLLALRFAIAAVLFWVVVLVRRPALPAGRDALLAVALGAVGYAVQAACYFGALTRIDASLTALLLYINPALVFAGAVLLGRDRADRLRLAALAAAVTGAALVLVGGGGGLGAVDALGVSLAIGAAVFYAAYILVADRAVARLDPFAVAAYLCTGATVTFLVVLAARGGPAPLTAEGLGWSAAIALVSTVGAVSTFFLALRLVGPSTAAIVSTLEPVVTVVTAIVLLGEALGALQVAGGALVVAASLLVARGTPARTARRAAAREAAVELAGR